MTISAPIIIQGDGASVDIGAAAVVDEFSE
jgi:hypothetical protein